MKKIAFLLSFITILLLPWRVLAQSEENKIDLAKLSHLYYAVAENFVYNVRNENDALAFPLTAGALEKAGSVNFKKTVKAMGLRDYTEKKWTYFKDELGQTGVTTVKGEFKTPDGITHFLTFYFIIGGDKEIRVGNITEEIPLQSLAQRFPTQEDLHALILKDLTSALPFVRKHKTKDFYNYLSNSAKTRTSLKEVRKAFRKLKKTRKNIYLPKKGKIILTENSPQLSQDGLMLISGAFENKKSVINFTLGYDYEPWDWEFGLLSINAQSRQ